MERERQGLTQTVGKQNRFLTSAKKWASAVDIQALCSFSTCSVNPESVRYLRSWVLNVLV